jgi:hypothetical protein
VGLTKTIANGLHLVGAMVESLGGGDDHGPWCDRSKGWTTESDEFIVPVRVGEPFLDAMLSKDGWEAPIASVFLRPHGDRTFDMNFKRAEEIDQISNRAAQRMIMTALDLAQELDMGNDDLSEGAIEALAEFRKAARSRIPGLTS